MHRSTCAWWLSLLRVSAYVVIATIVTTYCEDQATLVVSGRFTVYAYCVFVTVNQCDMLLSLITSTKQVMCLTRFVCLTAGLLKVTNLREFFWKGRPWDNMKLVQCKLEQSNLPVNSIELYSRI